MPEDVFVGILGGGAGVRGLLDTMGWRACDFPLPLCSMVASCSLAFVYTVGGSATVETKTAKPLLRGRSHQEKT
jgi:hypothetical protein